MYVSYAIFIEELQKERENLFNEVKAIERKYGVLCKCVNILQERFTCPISSLNTFKLISKIFLYTAVIVFH